MKLNIRVPIQPFIIAFVYTVIIENYMDLFFIAIWQLLQHLIHECQKLHSPFKLGGLRVNGTRGHVERSKKVQGAMALISTFKAADNFAAAGADIT